MVWESMMAMCARCPVRVVCKVRNVPAKFPRSSRAVPAKFPHSSRKVPAKFPQSSRNVPAKLRSRTAPARVSRPGGLRHVGAETALTTAQDGPKNGPGSRRR